MHRRALIGLTGSLLFWASTIAIASSSQEPRKPPKKPEQPFTVYVFTEGLTNEDVDMPKVAEEVAKRIGSKKNWLKVVDEREGADFVVEVLTHLVSEQHRRELDMRVDFRGTGKSYYDNNWITERHRIEARVTLPTRAQKILTGADERERGGSVKGAANHLAEQLEDYSKENYWDLVAR